ncbi:trypsin-like peptidase domain-containing protein [Pasteuria penetrans]|uniref:trypsin-like peptidase domain-containing protein n=1 Tax=Pasteuria penetrans TaxID=86005 RepID=UPI000FB20CA1|nr:trypsin-like peptidase domain-containing protein [Pasteuria penetrans]
MKKLNKKRCFLAHHKPLPLWGYLTVGLLLSGFSPQMIKAEQEAGTGGGDISLETSGKYLPNLATKESTGMGKRETVENHPPMDREPAEKMGKTVENSNKPLPTTTKRKTPGGKSEGNRGSTETAEDPSTMDRKTVENQPPMDPKPAEKMGKTGENSNKPLPTTTERKTPGGKSEGNRGSTETAEDPSTIDRETVENQPPMDPKPAEKIGKTGENSNKPLPTTTERKTPGGKSEGNRGSTETAGDPSTIDRETVENQPPMDPKPAEKMGKTGEDSNKPLPTTMEQETPGERSEGNRGSTETVEDPSTIDRKKEKKTEQVNSNSNGQQSVPTMVETSGGESGRDEQSVEKPSPASETTVLHGTIPWVIQKAEQSTVAIAVNRVPGVRPFPFPKNLIQEEREMIYGSGVVIKEENGETWILTNHHVVENGQGDIDILTAKGEEENLPSIQAKFVGSDPGTDLSVVKIRSHDLQGVRPATFASSDSVRKGETVVASGSPMGIGQSHSAGIVTRYSKKGSDFPMSSVSAITPGLSGWELPCFSIGSCIQTDAHIEKGNSGGPLFNMRAEVVGINESSMGRGTGFAIPSNLAKRVAEQLIKHGRFRRGNLGALGATITPELRSSFNVPDEIRQGMVITAIEPGGVADRSGFHEGDIFTHIKIDNNKIRINNLQSYNTLMNQYGEPGKPLTIEYYPQGNRTEVEKEVLLEDIPGTMDQDKDSTEEIHNPAQFLYQLSHQNNTYQNHPLAQEKIRGDLFDSLIEFMDGREKYGDHKNNQMDHSELLLDNIFAYKIKEMMMYSGDLPSAIGMHSMIDTKQIARDDLVRNRESIVKNHYVIFGLPTKKRSGKVPKLEVLGPHSTKNDLYNALGNMASKTMRSGDHKLVYHYKGKEKEIKLPPGDLERIAQTFEKKGVRGLEKIVPIWTEPHNMPPYDIYKESLSKRIRWMRSQPDDVPHRDKPDHLFLQLPDMDSWVKNHDSVGIDHLHMAIERFVDKRDDMGKPITNQESNDLLEFQKAAYTMWNHEQSGRNPTNTDEDGDEDRDREQAYQEAYQRYKKLIGSFIEKGWLLKGKQESQPSSEPNSSTETLTESP